MISPRASERESRRISGQGNFISLIPTTTLKASRGFKLSSCEEMLHRKFIFLSLIPLKNDALGTTAGHSFMGGGQAKHGGAVEDGFAALDAATAIA